MGSYGGWLTGRAGDFSLLPRDPRAFLDGAFGPMTPLPPTPIDAPPSGRERPLPRYWQYPVGWNLPTGQPGTEGLKLVVFANLRAYAEIDAVTQACLTVRKEEVAGIEWDIVPTADKAKSMRDNSAQQHAFQKRRAEMMRFWRNPDPERFPNFQAWHSALLEDHFVLDALSLYIQPPRLAGHGVLGSNVAALNVLDGATVKPLLNLRGGKPRPPQPAFSQYLWGISRRELIDMVLNGDVWEFAESVVRREDVANYTGDELMYLPYNTRAHTPYGFSLVERTIVPIAINLKAQQYALAALTEGTIPDTWVSGGPTIDTPEQVRRLEDALNAVAGDVGMMHKVRVVPNGSKVSPAKPPNMMQGLSQVYAERVCMGLQVNPMEIGLMPGSRGSGGGGSVGLGGKGFGDQNENIQFRKATVPLLRWEKAAIFDFVMQDIMGADDMEWRWVGVEPEEDQRDKEAALLDLRNGGILSTDDVRVELGRQPWNLPLTSDPIYFTPSGLYPLTTKELGPETERAPVNPVPGTGPARPEAGTESAQAGHTRVSGATAPTPETLFQPRPPAPSMAGKVASTGLTKTVHDYVAQTYPERVLGWVDRADWSEQDVPLGAIDMGRRPGGRDDAKTQAIQEAIRSGKSMDPVVLVKRSDGSHAIADGYHRTKAYEREGIGTIHAYVGEGAGEEGPWDEAMHAAKENKAVKRVDIAQEGRDYWSSSRSGIDWGHAGDFDDCVAHMRKYVDDPEGYCQERHIQATGHPAGHAPGEQKDKLAEVEQLRHFVRHGRAIGTFRPNHLSDDEFIALIEGYAARGNETFKLARDRILKQAEPDPKADSLSQDLLDLAERVLRGDTSPLAAYDDARTLLSSAVADAYRTGFGGGPLSAADEAAIDARIADESRFLWGLLQSLGAGLGTDDVGSRGSPAQLRARLAQWGRMLHSAQQAGALAGALRDQPGASFRWLARPDACHLCAARNGTVYTAATLPGIPGDGGYGDLCEGGPLCRCSVEVVADSGN